MVANKALEDIVNSLEKSMGTVVKMKMGTKNTVMKYWRSLRNKVLSME